MVEENWLKVAGSAMALGLGLYIVPLTIVRHPVIINFSHSPVNSILVGIQIGLGLYLLSRGIIGNHTNKAYQLLFIVAGSVVAFFKFL